MSGNQKLMLVSANKEINLNDVAFKLTGKLTAKPGEKSEIGKTYIPALTLNMKNVAPVKLSSAAEKERASNLPDSFNWSNDDDVQRYKGDDMTGLIMPPQNQLACGSCWAWASVTSLSDRIAIATGNNPMLGPSYLLSCSLSDYCDSDNLQACEGGILSIALEDLSNDNAAAVPDNCWSYKWCADDSVCSGGSNGESDNQKYNNSLIPNFSDDKGECVNSSISPTFYRVVKKSVNTLNDFDQIKQSIYDKGPIPTGFYVFNDFFLGTMPKDKLPSADNWAKTNGIYIHLDCSQTGDGKWLTPVGDPPCYDYASADIMYQVAGAHAVVIVGWGSDSVDNLFPISQPGKSITVPYWIVRNSWGTDWNGDGYFKIAMTNADLHINNTVLFDSSKGDLGGIVDFEASTSGGFAPVGKKNKNGTVSENANWTWIVMGIVVLLFVIGIIWILTRRK